jgi:membrane protein required for colicin V production
MILDVIVALVIAYGAYVGYSRGLIKTVFDTLSILVAIIASLKLSPIVINAVESAINVAPAISFIIGIVLTFIIVMALVRFIGRKLEGFFKATNLNFINKFAGAALQGLFFAIIISFIVLLGDRLSLLKEETKVSSISYKMLKPLPEKSKEVFEMVKPIFQDFWDKTIEAMDGIEEKVEDSSEKEN